MNALRKGDIVDVEEAWRGQHRDLLPESIPFQPYAAMAQWLLDTLSSDR